MLRKVTYIAAITFGTLITLVLVYVGLSFGLSRVSVPGVHHYPEDFQIYILTNGVHTDIVVPVKNEMFDWTRLVSYNNTTGKDSTAGYLAFGWGDKGFYLQTPTWDDLTFSVACSAMFGLSEAAIHATYYRHISENGNCRRITVSKEGYAKLTRYILNGFDLTPDGNTIYIETTANYGTSDAFYEGTGKYSLFHTCNTWANNGLKAAGLTTGVWTAFDEGIFYHYPDKIAHH